MAGGNFKDFVGDKICGWTILRQVGRENGHTMYEAEHGCGHRQVVRIDAIKRPRTKSKLCRHCSGFPMATTDATTEAREEDGGKERKHRAKKGQTSVEALAEIKRRNDEMQAARTDQFNPSDTGSPRRRIKLTAWQVGYEQAKAMSRFNF